MAISHGMNPEAVRALGNKLQQHYSTEIDAMMRQIQQLVQETTSTWVGPDAEQFRGWWPEKAAHLKAISEDLFGFGQSALNNVSEQEGVSGR